MRELARLADAVERFAALRDALPAIGRSRAQMVSPLLNETNADEWIARARSSSVRDFRDFIQAHRFDAAVERDALEHRMQVRVLAWPAVRDAFDELASVGRCVMGHDATVASIVDAMLGEAECEPRQPAPGAGIDSAKLEHAAERAMEHATEHWSLMRERDDSRAALHAVETLQRTGRIAQVDPAALNDVQLERHVKQLIALEDQVQRRLGALLVEMSERGAWARLMFNGLGHYAEERLGMSRTSAEDRAFVARALTRLPALRAAYGDGRLKFEKALIVARVLGRGAVDGSTESAWIDRARACTVKRLQDEAGVLKHSASKEPLDDATWYASIRRAPGDARIRVMKAGLDVLHAIEHGDRPDVFLRLRLPESIALRLMAAIEDRRREIEAEVASVAWDQPWPANDARPAVRAARELHVRARRVPACLGLLSLIEETVAAWDPVRMPDQPREHAVHERAGWRCEAPGCTNRDRLERHHIDRVSQGGSDDDANGLTLCWTHHHEGEHGGLTCAEGTAPLDVTWRVGTGPFARCYRNERELRPDA